MWYELNIWFSIWYLYLKITFIKKHYGILSKLVIYTNVVKRHFKNVVRSKCSRRYCSCLSFYSAVFQLHSTLRRGVLGLRAKIDSDIYLLNDTFILLGKYFNKNIVWQMHRHELVIQVSVLNNLHELIWNKFDTFRKLHVTLCKMVAPLLMKLDLDFMTSYYNTAKLY